MEKSAATSGSAKEILSILKSLKAEIRQIYKAEVKGIFGSYVRGEQKEGSDIDVLVELDEAPLDLTGLPCSSKKDCVAAWILFLKIQ
jgi:predicted nucleotidyltransferase